MQPIDQYKYLKFSSLANAVFWDFYSLNNKNRIASKFPLIKLEKVLKQRKGFITIHDEEIYKLCRVQIHGKGVILRGQMSGKSIKTKKQQLCKMDDFLVAEIDAKVGGFGIVPYQLDGAIVSGHYFLFEIDKTVLLPEYLGMVVKLSDFSKQVKSTGSTNYAAIRPHHVLEYQIPLPTIIEQTSLVNKYREKNNQAEKLYQQANDLESEIEKYFLEQLGLKPFSAKERNITLQFTDYMFLDRWDFFSTDTRIAVELKESKFELSSIGKSFSFAKRTFNKGAYHGKTFNYIEIGGIDTGRGIVEVKEIEISKAPSRATQLVKTGDLIIGMTRPYLKKFAIVTDEYDGNVCSSGFSIIEQSKKYHLPYLQQFLKCTYGIEQLKNKMTGGLYPAINESELKNIKIPFPNVEIQKEIMTLIEKKRINILNNKSLIASIKFEAEKELETAIFS